VSNVDTGGPRGASGVTRMSDRDYRRCPRCHGIGSFAPDSIVCQRCAQTRSVLAAVTVTVTVLVSGGDR
jgi:DnaJ-class molecular chaperone